MSLRRQTGRFALVGLGATLVHLVSGSMLVAAGIPALVANLPAFLISFGVSFLGHWRYTFPDRGIALSRALRRFLLVAIFGFGLNESILAVLLRVTEAEVTALLCAVLISAVATFVLGRNWAFRTSGAPARPENLR